MFRFFLNLMTGTGILPRLWGCSLDIDEIQERFGQHMVGWVMLHVS